MNNTTRIADLPENVMIQMNRPDDLTESVPGTNYMPINVHPNPYGVSAQNPIMPPMQHPAEQQMMQMQQLEQMSGALTDQQKAELLDMRQVRLPSKHVQIDTQSYMQDQEVQPNYIPRPKLTKDYIHDYEEEYEKKKKDNDSKKHRESKIDEILTELQTPILVAILFMVFQLPIINTLIFKKFSFLSIYHEDGNFNFYGLVFKSVFFGSCYYTIQKVIEYLSDL
jgi:hypothetical protein